MKIAIDTFSKCLHEMLQCVSFAFTYAHWKGIH